MAQLGADEVRSFDRDADSVAATQALRQRFRSGDLAWDIGRGDILDDAFVEGIHAAVAPAARGAGCSPGGR